jgi:hypothetical protein
MGVAVMPFLRRRVVVATAAVCLVLGLTFLVDRYATPGMPGPPLSVHSTQPDGARALYLWSGDLGYQTGSLEYRFFAVDPRARVFLMLAPTDEVTDAQVAETVGWVERGGTLVVVTRQGSPLLDKLGVKIQAMSGKGTGVVPLQPVFQRPPLHDVEIGNAAALSFTRREWVPLLGLAGSQGDVIAAVAQIGSGRAFVLSSEYPLSNEGLGKADNWALAQYLFAGIPASGLVLFDEYHHGLTESGTLDRMLLGEPWGWAILYSGALVFVYLALSGRRLGPALAASATGRRRSRSEYVATLASMLRQGKHRAWLCRQFAEQAKRALGIHFRVRTDLPSTEFAAVLERVRPGAADLSEPLRRLEEGSVSDDRAVVDLMRDVEAVRARLLG